MNGADVMLAPAAIVTAPVRPGEISPEIAKAVTVPLVVQPVGEPEVGKLGLDKSCEPVACLRTSRTGPARFSEPAA